MQILGDHDRKRKYDAESNQAFHRNIRYENHYRTNTSSYNATAQPPGPYVWFRRAGWTLLATVPAAACFCILSGLTDQLWDSLNRGKAIRRVSHP